MKYVALLRGVNVGGNAIIKMADLKRAVEGCGFTGVTTYIQSGNVIFESDEPKTAIAARLEDCLSTTFGYKPSVVLRTSEEFKQAVDEVPPEWKERTDLRCYMAFVREPVTANDVMSDVEPKEGIDFIEAGRGVVYMATVLSGLTRSGLTKLIARPSYKDITIRNYNTAKKLLDLIDGKRNG